MNFSRRDLAGVGAAAAVGLLTSGSLRAQPGQKKKPLKPRRLAEGDTLGMVLPASMAFERDRIYMAREQLETIGFKVRFGEHVFEKSGYFAGADLHRAADINRMFADDDVKGIVCFSGGWGSPRVLPHLDFDLIERKPKVIIGFSDITALLNVVNQRTGLITFHGPNGDSNMEPYTLDNFRRAVMQAEPIGKLVNPPKNNDELVARDYRVFTIRGGRARGRAVGGNLTLMAALMGTRFELDTQDSILFLEDIQEEPYRVDRMLTQLWLGGKFDRLAGVVFGRCTECAIKGPSFSIEELIRERFGSLGVPVMSGFAFGHIPRKLTIPLGMSCTMDADEGSVTIEDSAVI